MKKNPPAASATRAATPRARSAAGGMPASEHQPGAEGLAHQRADTQALVAAMPWNANKPLEIGRANAIHPPEGLHHAPASAAVTASTLSESNRSGKTGEGTPPPGVNASIASLDREGAALLNVSGVRG
mgnify:FL=1